MNVTPEDVIATLKYLQFGTTASIILSCFSFIIFLIWKGVKTGLNELDFSDIIPIALSFYSILGGIKVIIFGLENTAASMDGTQQFYIVIGGGAVIFNGCKSIRKKVIETLNPKDKKGKEAATKNIEETPKA